MAKARASQKSGRNPRKPGKAKPDKARSAKRRPKPTLSPAKAARKPAVVSKLAKPLNPAKPRKLPPVVEIPEIPPPLPAPIASFTF